MSDRVEVARIPACDVCKYEDGRDNVPAVVDGKTTRGPWANMCERHWGSHGVGRLGTGFGQRLVLRGEA